MKVAKLIYVSLATRVVVEDTATEEEIMELAMPRFVDKIVNELGEHIESIEDDNECPYDEFYDESIFKNK